jgi:hypothetical protein
MNFKAFKSMSNTMRNQMEMRRKRQRNMRWLVLVGIVVLIMSGLIFNFTFFTFNDHEITVELTEKERVANRGGNGARFMVWGRNLETGEIVTLENTDILWRGKFNSADIQGSLQIGETYRLVVVGRRIPFLSMNQNILEVHPLSY